VKRGTTVAQRTWKRQRAARRIDSTGDWIGAAARASSRRWCGEAARGSDGGSLAMMALGAVRITLTVALFMGQGEWSGPVGVGLR
jgi:hypothetical protein